MMRFLLLAVTAAVLAVATPVVAAVDDAGPLAQQQAATPDDSELSAFVAAFLRLVGVQHGYMMMLRDEEDPARLEEIKQSAMTDMKSAVEQDGLTVDRYNQIALSVRDDPALRDKVQTLLQQMAAGPSDEQVNPDDEE
ncbi:MAG TPA: DUF4168 domain-containing protein [Magnetospirillum sp.]|jgi:hypothetical protein|nr:DUF4168 domain-containing protein [Magnetospirillum sp.]